MIGLKFVKKKKIIVEGVLNLVIVYFCGLYEFFCVFYIMLIIYFSLVRFFFFVCDNIFIFLIFLFFLI